MHRPVFLLLAILLATPSAALAQYLVPEDVLIRDQKEFLVPSNPRAARKNAEAQRKTSTPPAVLEQSKPLPEPTKDPPVVELDPATQEQLERSGKSSHNGPNIVGPAIVPITRNPEALHSSALHSGASLAGSGPGAAMAFGAIGCAIAWTILRSSRQRQFHRP